MFYESLGHLISFILCALLERHLLSLGEPALAPNQELPTNDSLTTCSDQRTIILMCTLSPAILYTFICSERQGYETGLISYESLNRHHKGTGTRWDILRSCLAD